MNDCALDPTEIANQLEQLGYRHIASVGCSVLEPISAVLRQDSRFNLLEFCNEGTAFAYALGYEALHGEQCLVALQNSGLGNLVNPATAMSDPLNRRPALLVGHRGGQSDEEQHKQMGAVTISILESLKYRPVAINTPTDFAVASDKAPAYLVERGRLKAAAEAAPEEHRRKDPEPGVPSRRSIMDAVVAMRPDSLIVGGVGYIGRELAAAAASVDHRGTISLAGGMGCVSALAAGLSVGAGSREVIVVEGDGSALMRLETLHDIARLAPTNLVHIVLNNHCHESTGGQRTDTPTGSIAQVADAFGYPATHAIQSQSAFEAVLRQVGSRGGGPTLIECEVSAGGQIPPRPTLSMADQLATAAARNV